MENELKALAANAIAYFAEADMFVHNQMGCGDYEPDDRLLDLLREAKRLGVTLAPLYEGHTWPEV